MADIMCEVEVSTAKRHSRKRKRNPKEWTRSVNKRKKAEGEEHERRDGTRIPARKTGPPCTCKRNCFSFFTEVERQQIVTEFNALGSKDVQDANLFGLISRRPVHRRRTRNGTRSNARDYSCTYKVKRQMREVVVCKVAFAALHGVTMARVTVLLKRTHGTATSPLDKRGKHSTRVNRIPDAILGQIDEHIQSFPAKSSHYSRSKNYNKKYLSESLSVALMHRLYLETYEEDVAAELALGGSAVPQVKYEFYLNRFNTHHNLSFGRPRSDTCPTCDSLELKIREESDNRAKEKLQAEREMHHRKAERFYSCLKEYTLKAQTDKTVATLCFDFQQNLPSPIIPVGELFYARQLWLYNFCVHDCGANDGTMYCWDETQAKRGSNEVASCLLHYFTSKLADEVETLYLFSDGCGGQNKNYTIVWFFLTLIKLRRFKSIVHIFPVRGHSFLPCDRDFASIEFKKRKVETLYVPEQWYDIILSSRVSNKFEVVRTSQEFIFDFQSHLATFFKKNPKDGKDGMKLRDARVLEYSDPKHVKVKYSMSSLENPRKFILDMPRRTVVPSLPSEPMYNMPLPIKPSKLKDLQNLSKKYLPAEYKSFYECLTSTTTSDNVCDSDEEI